MFKIVINILPNNLLGELNNCEKEGKFILGGLSGVKPICINHVWQT